MIGATELAVLLLLLLTFNLLLLLLLLFLIAPLWQIEALEAAAAATPDTHHDAQAVPRGPDAGDGDSDVTTTQDDTEGGATTINECKACGVRRSNQPTAVPAPCGADA